LTIFLLLGLGLSNSFGNRLSTKIGFKKAIAKRNQRQLAQTQGQLAQLDLPADKDKDVELAQYSNDIYNGCFDGATVCKEETGHSVRYALLVNPDKCYIIIRGTQNTDNWVSDMDFPLVQNPFGQGMVHQGFLAIMNNIIADADYMSGLDQCAKSSAYMAFTGHSLGGAVATLAALHFMNAYATAAYQPNLHYATFGSPRVGNYYFQQDVLKRLSHMGNRYEAVQSEQGSTLGSWFGFPHTSPCGDKALPGDFIPRVPPITPIATKLSELAIQISTPAFWVGSGDLLSQFLDFATDDEQSRQGGYRHVGARVQITCDNDNLITCHSITSTYLPAMKSADPNALRANC